MKLSPCKRISHGICMWLVMFGVWLASGDNARAQVPRVVEIGMVETLFRDVPPSMMKLMTVPFGSLMRTQTGYNGKMVMVKDAFHLAKRLEAKQVHLGVFHGFEFAWAQQKNPHLKPLVIAVNKQRNLFANVVTRNDRVVKRFADLKGTQMAIPKRSRGHCHLFLKRKCEEIGCKPDGFFSKIVRHADFESALDDVIRGRVAGIIVDGVSLQNYKVVKPGCFARLRIAQQSMVFPAAVIAYREGHLDKATLHKLRSGMIRAHTNFRSRMLMRMCNLTSFDSVPANYQRTLDNIRRVYPCPITKHVSETKLPPR